MKKFNFLRLFTVFLSLLFISICAFGQTEEPTAEKTNVLQKVVGWIIGIGIPLIAATLPALWKKVTGLWGKVGGLMEIIFDGVINISQQIAEAAAADKAYEAKLRMAIEDGAYTDTERLAILDEWQKVKKEQADVGKAIKELISKIKAYRSVK